MKTYNSIIQRCKNCQRVHLTSERHSCKLLEIDYEKEDQFLLECFAGQKLKATELCTIANKAVGHLRYTQFTLAWMMKNRFPELFFQDENGYWMPKGKELLA